VSTELVLAPAPVVDVPASDRELQRRFAEQMAVRWLHEYTSPHTRNAFAYDIGLSPEARAAPRMPGGPTNPKPAPWWSWIPWALDHGIDPAGNLSKAQAESYVHALKEAFPDKKNVRRRRWTALVAYYRSLRAENVVSCNPNDLINRRTMSLSGTDPSSTLPLSPRQIRALYVAVQLAPARTTRPRYQAMLAVLASTGCRAMELVGLDLDDLRFHPEGHAQLQLDGKGDKKRWVTLPAADAELVTAYLRVRVSPPETQRELALVGQVSSRPGSTPLFTTSTGRRVDDDMVSSMLRAIARLPSLDDPRPAVREAARQLAPIQNSIRPHQFRHSYADTASRNGVPIEQIAHDLGHANIATTDTYLHASRMAQSSAAPVVSGIYRAGVVDLRTQLDPTEKGATP
jgi:site-specific recombinase XerD